MQPSLVATTPSGVTAAAPGAQFNQEDSCRVDGSLSENGCDAGTGKHMMEALSVTHPAPRQAFFRDPHLSGGVPAPSASQMSLRGNSIAASCLVGELRVLHSGLDLLAFSLLTGLQATCQGLRDTSWGLVPVALSLWISLGDSSVSWTLWIVGVFSKKKTLIKKK